VNIRRSGYDLGRELDDAQRLGLVDADTRVPTSMRGNLAGIALLLIAPGITLVPAATANRPRGVCWRGCW